MTASLPVRMPADGGVARHTNAARQRRKRARLADAGLVQCNVWVPAAAAAELRLLAEILRTYPHLLPGPLRDPVSGKLVSTRARRPPSPTSPHRGQPRKATPGSGTAVGRNPDSILTY